VELSALKILYHHRIASRDGQWTHIEEMVTAFRDLGHEVLLVGPEVGAKDDGKGGSAGWVGVLKRKLPRALYEVLEFGYSALALVRLLKAIRRFQPDFIYERYQLHSPAGGWAARLTGLPIAMEVNAPFAQERAKFDGLAFPGFAQWVENKTLAMATRVYTVTEVLKQRLIANGHRGPPIDVTPNAINVAYLRNMASAAQVRAEFSIPSHHIVVGLTGFVREWDRLDEVIALMAKHRDIPLHLMIVGDGPVRDAITQQAVREGLADRLTFTGVVPRTAVPRYVNAFDIAMVTSLVDYQSPLCLFEYMALGKPMVLPDQANIREVAQHDQQALLYGHGLALDEALVRMASDTDLRERLGRASRQQFEQRAFVWTTNARVVIQQIRV
jgi:glycosyltransferase involved in cell wall biosynthesis